MKMIVNYNKGINRLIHNYIVKARELNKQNKSCHIAILLRGKKIVTYGFNNMDRQCYRGKPIFSMHAEIDCLRKYKPSGSINKRNYTLVVVKVAKLEDKYYDSMPCKNCTKVILELGIKKLYCSRNNGDIVKINLKEYVPYNF